MTATDLVSHGYHDEGRRCVYGLREVHKNTHTHRHTLIMSLVYSVITICPPNSMFCSVNLPADSWSHSDWWAPNQCEEPPQGWKWPLWFSHLHGWLPWPHSKDKILFPQQNTWVYSNSLCNTSKIALKLLFYLSHRDHCLWNKIFYVVLNA